MARKNSKQKGNGFERLISNQLSEHFSDDFRRTPQSGAITGGLNRKKAENLREDAKDILSSDIIAPAWFPFLIECKAYADEPKFHQIINGESKKLDEWIEQVDNDAKFASKSPLLIFKINRKGTFVAFNVNEADIKYNGYPFMVYKNKTIFSAHTIINTHFY